MSPADPAEFHLEEWDDSARLLLLPVILVSRSSQWSSQRTVDRGVAGSDLPAVLPSSVVLPRSARGCGRFTSGITHRIRSRFVVRHT